MLKKIFLMRQVCALLLCMLLFHILPVQAQTSLGQGQTGCLIHSLHAEGDNVLYKGACSLWNIEKITFKE